jgi:hypothetical protein
MPATLIVSGSRFGRPAHAVRQTVISVNIYVRARIRPIVLPDGE